MFVNLNLEEHSHLVHVADIILHGPDGPGTAWQPSIYFESRRFNSCISSVKISLTWKDQGWWGSQKGCIYLQLIRPILPEHFSINSEQKSQVANEDIKERREILVAEYAHLFGNAPHILKSAYKTLTCEDPVISLLLPGDYFRVMKKVGGGGGHHQLIVNNFRLEIRRIVKRVKTPPIDTTSVNVVETRKIFEDFSTYGPNPRIYAQDVRRTNTHHTLRARSKIGLNTWRRYLKSPNIRISNVMAN